MSRYTLFYWFLSYYYDIFANERIFSLLVLLFAYIGVLSVSVGVLLVSLGFYSHGVSFTLFIRFSYVLDGN